MKQLLIIFLLLSSLDLFAQKIPADTRYLIRLTDSGRTIQAEIKPVKINSLANDRSYYWFSGGEIHATQGGYTGKLLNGKFTAFYSDKSLQEQGNFKDGLKDDVWKSWNKNGTLASIVTWDEGIREGKYSFFDTSGRLTEEGQYHRDVLHGKIKFYGADSVRTVKYRNGIIVHQKQSLISRKMNKFNKWLHSKKASPKTNSQQHS